MKKWFIIILMVVLTMNLVNAYVVNESNFPDYKIEQYGSAYIMAEKVYHCDWKPDSINDGYKDCGLEISLYNDGLFPLGILMNENNFDLEITEPVNATYFYSTDFFAFGGNLFYSNWIAMDGSIPVINYNEFLAIKVTFELPQYAEAQYNMTYVPLSIKLDPDISSCGRLGSSGTYTLIQNITATRDCLTIGNDDIIVNLNGYTITGDGGVGDYGIVNSMRDNLIVNGPGYITNFDNGINTGGDNGIFNGVTITETTSGIYLGENANNNTATGNQLNNNNNGILFKENTNNIAKNNILNANNNGIFLFGDLIGGNEVTDISIINNTINNSGNGMYIFTSFNITIVNNTIYSSDRGVYFDYVENSTFRNNDMWNVSSASSKSFIELHESNNNLFENNKLNKSFNYGIELTSTTAARTVSNNLFKDMNIINTDNVSVISTSTGSPASDSLNNTFLNVTYADESVDANSELIRKWYYRAYVQNVTPLDNANVTAFNVTGDYNFNLTTNASGLTQIGEIIDYVNYKGTKYYYSNYTIYATHQNCSDSHTYNATFELNNLNDTFYCVEVVDVTPPTFDNLINHTQEGNQSFTYDLDATDTSGISCFTLNDTSTFGINCSGWIENVTALDTVNLYWLNVSVNDTLDNTAYGTFFINITEEVVDTCTCPGLNQNWIVDMADFCQLGDCELGTGTLNWTGSGWANCTGNINTTNMGEPITNQILYVPQSCLINIGI